MNLPVFRHFLFLLLAAANSFAQTPQPAPTELTKLKTQYRSELQAASEPIRKKYIATLTSFLDSTRKANDLDAAIAVQQELDSTMARTSTVSGGRVTEQLTALKNKYKADLENVSKPLQTRYLNALQALQNSFTQRGKLADALAVRAELTVADTDPVTTVPDVGKKRESWKDNGSLFSRQSDGRWLESKTNGEQYPFRETIRNANYIELTSTKGPYAIRLFEDHAEIQRNNGPYNHFSKGSWIK